MTSALATHATKKLDQTKKVFFSFQDVKTSFFAHQLFVSIVKLEFSQMATTTATTTTTTAVTTTTTTAAIL